ncbi:hypothetical protein AXG93_1923s1000 [Marchantia polymorpha subsp. ruderalis]|uniref:Uncharacterized protein n=1 Tax=Marchantia polymorpha subsp. ruderalis TaxID=1480154 RepID=A0A176VCF4_MARPO|nr:hypothetical protein AXG93_1923s1000 [Marchantia polymorpha subsp. ruderalis]
MKAQCLQIEEEDINESSGTASQYLLTLEEWAEMELEEVETNNEWPSAEDLRPSKWRTLVVPAEDPLEKGEEQVGDTEVSLSTVNLNCGKGPSTEVSKLAK